MAVQQRCGLRSLIHRPSPQLSVPPGLVVTHGHTFSQAIPLDSVLSAIAEAVGPEDWPVFISLECHVPLAGQEELASMIKEKIGDKLVLGRNEDLGDNAATPKDFFGKILLMVSDVCSDTCTC